MKWVRVLFVVGIMSCCFSCSGKRKEKEIKPVKVVVSVVEKSSLSSVRDFVGVIEADKSIPLSFSSAGTVQAVNVKEGEKVSKGQVLASLNSASARNAMEASYSTFLQAEDAYKRMKKLYEQKSIPEIKMVEIETNLQKARSAYEISKKNYNDCLIYAPFSGLIGTKYVEPGVNVGPGTPVLSLLDIKKVKAHISVPEDEISSIGVKDLSTIKVPALKGKEFSGEIFEKHSFGDMFTHAFGVWILLDNKKEELLPGMMCNVKVFLGEHQGDNEIVIPIKAVQENSEGEKFVWKVVGDHAERCKVMLGNVVENSVVITEGLSDGDKVVIEGYQKISQDTKIVE